MLKLDHKLDPAWPEEQIRAANLCSHFTEDDLKKIGACVVEGFDRDKRSRADWERRNEAGMDLALQIQRAKNFPWPGCANVAFPLVTIAAMQFHARAYPTIIQGTEIVRCRHNGDERARERAERIGAHMSWQVLEEDASWEDQHDRELLNLSIVGTNFIKTYRNAREGHNVSELVLAKDLVVNYWAKSLEDAPRKTQILSLFRNDIVEKVRRKIYRNVLEEAWFLSDPPATAEDSTRVEQDNRQGIHPPGEVDHHTPWTGLEQHCWCDLDDDGYAEPYVIVVEKESQAVLRISPGFDREEDIERDDEGEIICIRPTQYYTKYGFIPSPDGGFYDIGFGVLLGPVNESVNTSINQLFDAGTWHATSGGFLGRGAKLKGGVLQVTPWSWTQVDAQGDDLRKSMVPFEAREPSAVLFNLLSLLINYANRISGATDMMVGENPGQNTPAETARTMVEMGQKVYNSIFKRVWRSMKEEFKKLYVLNAIYLESSTPFGAAGQRALAEDYRGNPDEVAPAADPNLTSEAERFNQARAMKESQMAGTPGYDVEAVERRYLRAIGLDAQTIGEVYPGLEAMPPGKSEKVQIEEMKLARAQEEFAGKMQLEAARLQLEAREMELRAMELQIEIKLELVELQGDVEDREVQRMNAMVSMLKSQADNMRSRADMMIAQLESVGASAEQLAAARESARADAELKLRAFVEAGKAKREERKLEQKDREIEIKKKQAARPKAAA